MLYKKNDVVLNLSGSIFNHMIGRVVAVNNYKIDVQYTSLSEISTVSYFLPLYKDCLINLSNLSEFELLLYIVYDL